MDTLRKHMTVSAKHCFSLVGHAILIHSGVLFLCFVFGTPLCDKRMSTFSGNRTILAGRLVAKLHGGYEA